MGIFRSFQQFGGYLGVVREGCAGVYQEAGEQGSGCKLVCGIYNVKNTQKQGQVSLCFGAVLVGAEKSYEFSL
jgi:hypothetical protein